MKKKIVFITGTRADYGKIKKVIKTLSLSRLFEVHIFVTGMHLLEKYGLTKNIILKENSRLAKIFLSKNQSYEENLDLILANTMHEKNMIFLTTLHDKVDEKETANKNNKGTKKAHIFQLILSFIGGMMRYEKESKASELNL